LFEIAAVFHRIIVYPITITLILTSSQNISTATWQLVLLHIATVSVISNV